MLGRLDHVADDHEQQLFDVAVAAARLRTHWVGARLPQCYSSLIVSSILFKWEIPSHEDTPTAAVIATGTTHPHASSQVMMVYQ